MNSKWLELHAERLTHAVQCGFRRLQTQSPFELAFCTSAGRSSIKGALCMRMRAKGICEILSAAGPACFAMAVCRTHLMHATLRHIFSVQVSSWTGRGSYPIGTIEGGCQKGCDAANHHNVTRALCYHGGYNSLHRMQCAHS